jgi:hypothetical protein
MPKLAGSVAEAPYRSAGRAVGIKHTKRTSHDIGGYDSPVWQASGSYNPSVNNPPMARLTGDVEKRETLYSPRTLTLLLRQRKRFFRNCPCMSRQSGPEANG